MADRAPHVHLDRRSEAVRQVDRFLSRMGGVSRLSGPELKAIRDGTFEDGWRVEESFSDGKQRALFVLVDTTFPYSPARIALCDGPDVLDWPHLERDGLLCLLPRESSVDVDRPAEVVRYLLGKACRLVEKNVDGVNPEDFRAEFLDYWNLEVEPDTATLTSILEPRPMGRQIAVWQGAPGVVVAEDASAIKAWIRRRRIQLGQNQFRPVAGALIWLREPLAPTEYPSTGSDLLNLVRRAAPDSESVLRDLVAAWPPEITVVLATAVNGCACFVALKASKPRVRQSSACKGFRPDKLPEHILAQRYLIGSGSVTKTNVRRADHMWIHGRDYDARQEQLRGCRVAFLGCGSVGSAVARLLAQAGVGNLLLVDPKRLKWENTGRHQLDARSIDIPKSQALAAEIQSGFPHLTSVHFEATSVSPWSNRLLTELEACDLVVSTMGKWTAECFLNDWQQERLETPPVLYGWVEPHAAAAHAVLVISGKGCLRCGLDACGRPEVEVSHWPKGQGTVQLPACGASFSPYGPAELAWAHALIAMAAIDTLVEANPQPSQRVWIGPKEHLEAQGGQWTKNWVEKYGDPGLGGKLVKHHWSKSDDCPACARGKRIRDD